MSQKTVVSPDKKDAAHPASGLLQHATVRSVAERSIPFASLTSSDFGHDFSQVTTRTTPSANGGTHSVSCPLSPRTCPFGGACHTCPVAVQTKLAINQPGDRYEQEADRVAEQIMGMPAREDEDDKPCKQPGCTGSVQRQGSSDSTPENVVPRIVDGVLRSSGQPLDAATRAFMERRFGQDFSRVRVHTDDKAVESARAVHALAYTVGQDVVFGSGEYAPGTRGGQHLLAHELVHTMQQESSNTQGIQRQLAGELLRNRALILGRVVDSRNQGIEHVFVTLNHVQASPEMGPFELRSLQGGSLVMAETDEDGYFTLGFTWDPVRIGTVMLGPGYQLNLQVLVNRGGHPTARLLQRYRGNMAFVVSLRALADGRIPDLRNPTAQALAIVRTALRIAQEIRIPNMFLSPHRPTPNYDELLGAAEIRITPPLGVMSWD